MRKLAESLFLSVGFSVDELTHFESKTGTLMRCLGLHQTPTEQTHPLFCLLSFLSDMLIDDSLVYAIKELQVQKRSVYFIDSSLSCACLFHWSCVFLYAIMI
ncbi:hypothetical protein V6N11_012596 [Hibiscus sabdariffa]|uniref:Uncharacterized protein n=1 Tax=Hibiscus sabdariffa TaxID=183260 RepID=A0ABR2QBP3_9ROSI